jgi:hypothetical protein
MRHIALVSETPAVSPAELMRVGAAILKQVTTQFGPKWGIEAMVSPVASLAHVPLGSWPVVVRDAVLPDGLGAHVSEDGENAFALVTYRPEDWTLTLSHEVLELLVDPFGTCLIPGPSPDDPSATVEYLAEVCDPCQGWIPDFPFYYTIDEVVVSDFVYRDYYTEFGEGRYSQAGNVKEPRELLAWGYMVWRDPATREWWYRSNDGTRIETKLLGANLSRPDIHLRGLIDRRVKEQLDAKKRAAVKKHKKAKGKKPEALKSYVPVPEARAMWWRAQIERAVNHSR